MKMLNNIVMVSQVLVALPLLIAASAAQADKQQTPAKYTDSVYNWGSWELGLEPAAGGPITLPGNAMSNRPADIRFRPNDNSVFNPGSRTIAGTTMNPTPAPLPVTPPTTGPVRAPVGSPSDFY